MNQKAKSSVFILGNLKHYIEPIDEYIPDGILFFFGDTHTGELARQCAVRRQSPMLGMPSSKNEDAEVLWKRYAEWIIKCDVLVVLYVERTALLRRAIDLARHLKKTLILHKFNDT